MLDLVLLVPAFAGGTWVAGWWSIPLISGLWGWWRGGHRPAWHAALAAALAWGGLFLAAGSPATLAGLIRRLGGIFGLPGWGLVMVALGYPALLAGVAARLMQGIPMSRSD